MASLATKFLATVALLSAVLQNATAVDQENCLLQSASAVSQRSSDQKQEGGWLDVDDEASSADHVNSQTTSIPNAGVDETTASDAEPLPDDLALLSASGGKGAGKGGKGRRSGGISGSSSGGKGASRPNPSPSPSSSGGKGASRPKPSPSPSPRPMPEHHKTPDDVDASYAKACEGKAVGTRCDVWDGYYEGKCTVATQGDNIGRVVCQTPEEELPMIKACVGKTPGAACTITERHSTNTLSGYCISNNSPVRKMVYCQASPGWVAPPR